MLAAHGGEALVIAGGTDVLPDIRNGKRAPRCLVDISRLPELQGICVDASRGCVQVGAAVTFAELRQHPFLCSYVHALAEAAGCVGALPIQMVATWAGNLVQAMPAADGAIAALALDAEARIQDATGATWLPVETLFIGPGRSAIDPSRQLVTHIRFGLPAMPWGTAWRRLGRRPSLILPTLNCAVKVVLAEDRSRIVSAAIALGPVATCPHRVGDAEAFLAGQVPGPEVYAEAGRLAQCDADPRSNVLRASREYRLAVVPGLLHDALATAVQRALSPASPSWPCHTGQGTRDAACQSRKEMLA
jgi:carbon-monoxide dehydrogenase medium subunit